MSIEAEARATSYRQTARTELEAANRTMNADYGMPALERAAYAQVQATMAVAAATLAVAETLGGCILAVVNANAE
jgi:hypothetical protein